MRLGMTPLSQGENIMRRPTLRASPPLTTSWPTTCCAWPGRQHGDWSGTQSPRFLLPNHYMDRREPPVGIFAGAVDHSEEFLLQALRDGAAAAGADRDPADGADRRNFGGRPAEEKLVLEIRNF